VNNIPAGGYTVTIRDANGCSITAAANVTDIGAPSVTATKVDILCNGLSSGSATSTVTAGIAPYTYTWSNGTNAPDISNVPAGTYILTVTANNGCKATTQVTITEPTALILSIAATDEVCGNGTGTATVTATGATPTYSYQWDNGSTGNTIANLNAGAYTATVTDQNGCSKTIATAVNNIANYGPTAQFTLDPSVTEILAPTIRFFDQTIGATTWHWDFGDGTTLDSVANPVHTYQDTGTYTICLTITNQYGCTSRDCHTVIIKPVWSFYIPNAFTPDGDGKNETFNGKGMGIHDYELYIFDRWGDLLFKSTSLATDWDGRANNGSTLVEEDVYIYLVKFKDPDNKRHRYTGSVTVVR
jgi:gliding motility-associated-like protein